MGKDFRKSAKWSYLTQLTSWKWYAALTGCIASLIAIGFLHWKIGTELDLAVLYFIPIVIASIYLGQSWGVLIALMATVTYHVALVFNITFVTVQVFHLNDVMHLLVFIFVAIVSTWMVDANLNLQALHEALRDVHGRIQDDLSVAQRLQMSILPKDAPQIPGLDIGIKISFSRHVGGDYCDFFNSPDNLGICIADISGKSVPAALFAPFIKYLMWEVTQDEAIDPSQILKQIDHRIYNQTPDEIFITMCYCDIDVPNRKMTIASAGHNAVLYYNAVEHKVIPLTADGGILGLEPEGEDREDLVVNLSSGDVVLMYTDGLVDIFLPDGHQFGYEKLRELLGEFAHLSADNIIEMIFHEAVLNTVREQRDDITMIAIKIK